MAQRATGVLAEDIAAEEPGVRAYLSRRGLQPADVDDIVQETLTRLLQVARRLDADTLSAYALAIAKNLVSDDQRRRSTEARHLPRLVDPDGSVVDLAMPLVLAEEQQAVNAALECLPTDMRELLLERYAGPNPDIAKPASGFRSGSKLARARARLRVDVVLHYRRATLPTARCRVVLVAISEGDRRRQTDLRVAQHLLACETCTDIVAPLLRRDRRLLVALPPTLLAGLIRFTRQHPKASSASAAGVAAGVVATALLATGPPPSPAAHGHSQPPQRAASCPAQSGSGRPSGQKIDLRATVVSVPANEGFVVDGCHLDRMWVHLRSHGESAIHVQADDRVHLVGRVVPVSRSELRKQGAPAASLTTLARDRIEITCSPADVHLSEHHHTGATGGI